VNDTVTLDGTASTDADHDPLTYKWSLTSVLTGSTATLSDATAANPAFVVDLPGTYVAQLVVNDGKVDLRVLYSPCWSTERWDWSGLRADAYFVCLAALSSMEKSQGLR
jgi:hypothetical protein